MTHNKIFSLENLAPLLSDERGDGRTIVHCHGVFDLLHPGHIRHFAQAKKFGDILVVTLTPDKYVNKGPGRPAFHEQLRAESIAALGQVDYVAITETPTAVEVINLIKPHFYVKGSDYEVRSGDLTQGIYAEEEAVNSNGGEIKFTHDISFSSTKILNNHFGVYPEKSRRYLKHFAKNHSADSIITRLRALKDLKVLVIGDTIVDEYHYCQPLGKSPKETIVSTRYLKEEAFPGGILACANHIAAFSENVHLVTCLGSQNTMQDLIETQISSKISTRFFYRDDAVTVLKRRYVEPAFLTKMFQIAFFNDTDLPEHVSQEVVQYLKTVLSDYDLVVVADYGHGFIDKNIRNALCESSKFMALNVQTNSANQGYNLVTKYPRADYICIDEPELRLAMSAKYAPIQEVIDDFASRYPKSIVTITRGHRGSITVVPDGHEGDTCFEAASVSNNIVDRVGAGDAYFAVTSLLAARKSPASIIGFVGNTVGAKAVEIVCNRDSIQAAPVYKSIKALLA